MGIFGHQMGAHFLYNNKMLPYNRIPKNNWSERTVEIPIVIDFLQEHGQEGSILEVGNVLSHYPDLIEHLPGLAGRHIIDKFEKWPGVINIDLMDVQTRYDVIVCASTVEHIGQKAYGEFQSGDLEAPLKAIRKIYDLLKPGGKAIVTVPFGRLTDAEWLIQFNSEYLRLLTAKYDIPDTAVSFSFMRKLDTDISFEAPSQLWVQCEERDLADCRFNHPFFLANGLAVIRLNKTEELPALAELPPADLRYETPPRIGNLYYSSFILPRPSDKDGWIRSYQPGFIFFGPYIKLPVQVYRFEVRIEIVGAGHFTLDITSNAANKLLWQKHLFQTSQLQEVIYLHEDEKDVEVRLYKHDMNACAVRVPSIYLAPL